MESHLKLQRPGVRGLLEEAYAWLQQDQTPEGLAAMVRSLAFAEASSLTIHRKNLRHPRLEDDFPLKTGDVQLKTGHI